MELNHTNYLELKQTGITRAKIAEQFSVPEWKLKKLISINNWGKKAPIIGNETAFDEYTEESCYWAGFLAADGCVDSKNRIRVMLQYGDIAHLEKLRNFLQSTHTISVNTDKYNRCSFELTSAYIRDILDINFNIVPNKTDKLKFPKHLPDSALKHYIRGYFDGDGSLCESFSNKNSITATIYACFASGSKDFSYSLYDYLQCKLGLVGHLQDCKDSVKWQIKFNTNDAKILTKYMYDNSIVYLDRKYMLYQRIIVNDNRLTRDKGIVHPTSNSGQDVYMVQVRKRYQTQ